MGLWLLDAGITVQWLCITLVAPELVVLCELLAPRTMEICVEGNVFLFLLQISQSSHLPTERLYFRKKWEIRVFRKKNQYTLEEHAAAIPFDLS